MGRENILAHFLLLYRIMLYVCRNSKTYHEKTETFPDSYHKLLDPSGTNPQQAIRRLHQEIP
jgi:hypothetical protein